MANSIGGGFETSIMMDVSGVRVATERGVEYLDNLAGSASRLGQSFNASSTDTDSLVEALRRASGMVELLSAKMLSQQIATEKARVATREYGKEAVAAAENQRSLTAMMMGGSLAATRQAEEAAAALAKYNQNLERSRQLQSAPISVGDSRSVTSAIMGGSLAAARVPDSRLSAMSGTGAAREDGGALARMMTGSAGVAAENAIADARRQRLQESLALQDAFEKRREAAHRAELRQIEDAERFRQQGIQQRTRMEEEAAERRQQYLRETQEIEDKFAQRNRSAYRAQLRQEEDARRFRAGARDPLRTTTENISPRFQAAAREAVLWERGRDAQEKAELSVRRMKAMLSPMVEMEMRLADEAKDFAQQLDLAVRSGHISLANAKLMTAEFAEQQKLLMQNAQQQQAGFLGMRRMGFAAQQFGYAIEDAASMYGTMGLSGAFRAAGNNLTAMAATMGPQVGVAASIAAAVASIGLHWWETKKAAEETAKANEKVLDLTERIQEHASYLLEINAQTHAARKADFAELNTMYERNLEQMRELAALENARVMSQKQLIGLTEEQNALREIEGRIAQDNAQWYEEQFRWTFAIGRYLKDAAIGVGSGVAGFFESEQAAALAEERFNAEARIAIEIQRQENALKRANSEAQKQLDLANQQSQVLAQQSRALGGEMAFGANRSDGYAGANRIRRRDSRNREFDVNDPRTMLVDHTNRFGFFGGDLPLSQQSTEADLASSFRNVTTERDRVLAAEQLTADLETRKRMQAEILRMNEELLHIDEMRVALNQAGQAAYENVNNTLMGRFEAMNSELQISNERLRVEREINDQLALAERSGHVDEEEAAAYRREMERVFQLEEENRNAEKEMARLKEAEGKLLRSATEALSPAGVVSGLTRGSDETRKFLEQEKMRDMAQKDAEPVVAELKALREEMKKQRAILERNAQAAPAVAEMF